MKPFYTKIINAYAVKKKLYHVICSNGSFGLTGKILNLNGRKLHHCLASESIRSKMGKKHASNDVFMQKKWVLSHSDKVYDIPKTTQIGKM